MKTFHLQLNLFVIVAILVLPTLIFAKQLALEEDGWTTETLNAVVYADWTTPREYDAINDLNKRFQVMLDDFSFESIIAEKARELDLKLDETDQNIIGFRKKQIFQETLKRKRIELTAKPDDQILERLAQEHHWDTPRPERYYLSYIRFLKQGTESDEDLEKKERLVEQVAAQCTLENFDDQARLWSEAASSLEGGNIGYIPVQRMGPEFLSQVRNTPVGTIGGPYETKTGWNIIWVKNHEMPGKRYTKSQKSQMARNILAEQVELSAEDQQAVFEAVEQSPELVALENARYARKFLQHLYNEQQTEPSEKDLELLYDELKPQLLKPRQWKARELRLDYPQWDAETSVKQKWAGQKGLRDQARDIRQQALDGSISFAEAAKKFSQAPTAASGGDLGWVTEPGNAFLDRILRKLDPGEISPPVATKQGMVLIYLEDDNSESRQMSFEECRGQLVEVWQQRRFFEFHQKYRKQMEAQSAR